MAETIVKIENLVKRYHELVAVDHFNLTVSKGEILGLLGPNGSGKTTTMNCLLSLLAYDKGSIEVFGKPMKPDSYDLKRNIGVVFQNVAVFDDLAVRRHLAVKQNLERIAALDVRTEIDRIGENIDKVADNAGRHARILHRRRQRRGNAALRRLVLGL